MRVLALALALAVAFAGCAGRGGEDEEEPPTGQPGIIGDPEAEALLARAARELPAVFSVDMNVTTQSGRSIGFRGTYDNATSRTFMQLAGDATTLAALSGNAGVGTYLTHGLAIYVTPDAAVYVANGSAFVLPDDPEAERIGSLLPNPDSGPLSALLRGDALIRGYADEDVTVTSSVETTWKGAPAREIVAQTARATGGFSTAKLIVLTGEPPRIAHVRTTMNGTSAGDPLANATLEGDLFYEEGERIEPTRDVLRAMGLGYKATKSPADPRNLTWTFLFSEGVRLEDVELQVKAPGNASVVDPSLLPTAWTMPLSEGTRTEGGITLVYNDADGDLAVSRGDTLLATTDADALPPLVLYDLVAGLRVLPFPGWLWLAGVALALALARRSF